MLLDTNNLGIHQAGVRSNFEGNASSFSNLFLNKFLFSGDFIASDVIQKEVDRFKPTNFAGSDLWINAYYQSEFKKNIVDYHRLELGYRDYISARFSDDFMKILLQGNAQFEDQTATFSGLNFYSYSALNLGYNVGKRINNKFSLEVGIDALAGTRFQQADVISGEVYTAPYGEYIEGQLDFTLNSANGGAIKGFGGSIDLNFEYQLSEKEVVNLGVFDVGMINWEVQELSYDSSFRFDGLVITDVFDSIQLSTGSTSPDSAIFELGFKEQTKKRSSSTPSTLGIMYTRNMGNGSRLIVHGQWNYVVKQHPLLFVGYMFRWGKNNFLTPNLSAGGFGSYNLGLGFEKHIGEKIHISIQTRFLDGLALYGFKGGEGAFISLSYGI